MTVCEQYRIPHSTFLDWDEDDREKAIWWMIRQKETCPRCGTRDREWDETVGGDRNAYGAEVRRCRGCEVKEMAEAADLSEYGKGIYIAMRKNDRPYAD